MKPRTIVVTIPGMISKEDLAPLAALSEIHYVERAHVSEEELGDLCTGADYLMLNYDVVKSLSESFYEKRQVRALRSIAADITGMDWASPKAAARNGVMLQNVPHYSTESVAESILAEILLHARERHSAYQDLIRGERVSDRKGFNLKGTYAGVVGLGSIGSRTAELLRGIGMEVLSWNRTPRNANGFTTLADLFRRSRVVCLCTKTVTAGPDANVGFVDSALLRQARDMVLVNLASWRLVDTGALAEALREGSVRGYSVERTPEALELPFAAHAAVHLAPVNAWASDESLQTLRSTWVGNVASAIRGRAQNVYVD